MTAGRLRGLLWIHAALIAVAAVAAGFRPWWPLFVGCAIAAVATSAVLYRYDAVSMRMVLTLAVLYRVAWIWLPPVLSDDIYRYVWDGLLVVSGTNPYAWAPDASVLQPFQDLELYRSLNSVAFYSVYPPVSQWVFGFAAWLSQGDPDRVRLALKGLMAIAELGAVVLLSRRVSPRALQLYAWHPVVLIAGAGQAHTEALMLPLLVAAVLWDRNRRILASVAMMLAGLVKLYPLLLMPYTWMRGRARSVIWSVTVGAVLSIPFWIPDVLGHLRASLDLYVRWFEFNAGPYYVVKGVFRWVTGEDWSKQLGPAFRVMFFLTLPVLYWIAHRQKWSLARLCIWVFGTFLFLSTTVHPWYLVSVLVVLPVLDRPGWHWQWLGACSLGTYLLYVDGPYWSFVWMGWIGFLVLGLISQHALLLDAALTVRARGKARIIGPWIPTGGTVLDLGGGEGHLARLLSRRKNASVTIAEIRPVDAGEIPVILYDGKTLPCESSSFDTVVLSFVLHHADDADRLLAEAVRVARGRIVVLESTYRTERERRLLSWLDPIANRIRSRGQMTETLDHRSGADWRALFLRAGADVIADQEWANPLHRKHLFVLSVPG